MYLNVTKDLDEVELWCDSQKVRIFRKINKEIGHLPQLKGFSLSGIPHSAFQHNRITNTEQHLQL